MSIFYPARFWILLSYSGYKNNPFKKTFVVLYILAVIANMAGIPLRDDSYPMKRLPSGTSGWRRPETEPSSEGKLTRDEMNMAHFKKRQQFRVCLSSPKLLRECCACSDISDHFFAEKLRFHVCCWTDMHSNDHMGRYPHVSCPKISQIPPVSQVKLIDRIGLSSLDWPMGVLPVLFMALYSRGWAVLHRS